MPGAASAQDADRIAALERQIAALAAEVQELKAAQAAAPAPRQQALAQQEVVGETTGVPVALQPSIQTPPSPGVAGHPFYATLPEGRTTGALATGNDKVRLTFSGQINRALNVVNDGISTDLYQVDNENASSRFRFLGETSPYNDTQALTLFEFEWPANGSIDVSQLSQSFNINDELNLRLLEVGFSNNNWGSFFIGQGWMASDGTNEIDISGITTPAWASEPYAFYGMLVTDSDSPFDYVLKPGVDPSVDGFDPENASNFVSIGNLMDPLDGLSRLVRVRYNSPVFAGFQLSASAATEDRYDVALRYAGETSWMRVAAGVAWWTDASDDGFDGWSGSASMLLTGENWYNGLSFTAAAAEKDFDQPSNGQNPSSWFGKVAYAWNPWEIGRTAVALTYGKYDNYISDDDSSALYGIGFSQNLDPFGTELYAAIYQTNPEIADTDVNDMTLFQLGAMVRF
ncbi:porin [uncultured Amaricoccus sp.]|uniref:porin n=1 Tax=uncultured Amaricoccus sp. TaxID=339341 RepID=UPI00260B5D32|nr:porin [uncultured Amaricoccus sp.]